MVRSMMSLTKLPMSFWGYAYLKNKIFVARYADFSENGLITQKESGSTVDFDEIQSEEARHSENTSNRLNEDELENEHELRDHREPSNYRAVMSTWEALEGNLRDLGSIGEETGRRRNPTRLLMKLGFTARGEGVVMLSDAVKESRRRRRNPF
ncbi:hypothetical protein Tco_1463938 [Tanacetum coccineum]